MYLKVTQHFMSIISQQSWKKDVGMCACAARVRGGVMYLKKEIMRDICSDRNVLYLDCVNVNIPILT